jgi:hypothetical protein
MRAGSAGGLAVGIVTGECNDRRGWREHAGITTLGWLRWIRGRGFQPLWRTG